MIRWCVYCQRFLGEVPPYTDLVVTHGMCAPCEDRALEMPDEISSDIHAIARFFSDTLRRADEGAPPGAMEVIEHGQQLGIQPVDLLLGIVQPLLAEVGRRFAAGRLPSAHEHKVSQRVLEIVAHFDGLRRRSKGPRFLLCVPTDNTHTIGPRIFSHVLAEHGVAVDVLHEGAHEGCLEAFQRGSYAGIGISIALPSQLRSAVRLATSVQETAEDTFIALGGYVTKDALPAGLTGRFRTVASPTESRGSAELLGHVLSGAADLPSSAC